MEVKLTMRDLCGSKGFTLLEIMIVLVLLGIVVAGGFQLYFYVDRALMSGSRMSDLQAEMHWAMQKIIDEVRLAHSLRVGNQSRYFSTVWAMALQTRLYISSIPRTVLCIWRHPTSSADYWIAPLLKLTIE